MKLIIYGQQPSLKNSKEQAFNKKTGHFFPVNNPEVKQYIEDFDKQILGNQRKELDGDLSLVGIIYYRSNRSDLSEELLMDCLEKSKVIINDRRIVHKNIYKKIDKNNPRVEIEINQLADYQLRSE